MLCSHCGVTTLLQGLGVLSTLWYDYTVPGAGCPVHTGVTTLLQGLGASVLKSRKEH